MSWQSEVDELRHRQKLSKAMGGPDAIAKQHAHGKLTVRERISALLDADSFHEIGSITGSAEYDDRGELKSFTHMPHVMGFGSIDGRPVCVEGGDFTIKGALLDPAMHMAELKPEKMALERRVPFIRLLDSAGGSVLGIEARGRTHLLGGPEGWPEAALMARVPVVAAALGSLGGGPPVQAVSSHWSIMTKTTSELFVGGPPLVKQALGIEVTKEELGDYRVHACHSGVIDNVAEDEIDAFQQIRLFLSYLPRNVWHQPPHVETEDDPNPDTGRVLKVHWKGR